MRHRARLRPAKRQTSRDGIEVLDLIELSSDWYWEQDEDFRFVRIVGGLGADAEFPSSSEAIGKRPWEVGLEVLQGGGWPAHHDLLASRSSYRDLIMYQRMPSGHQRWLSVSGVPIADATGRFRGYRGIGKDITATYEHEQELLLVRAAIDASPNIITLTDAQTLCFVYVNEPTVRASGFTREQLLEMGPGDMLRIGRAELFKWYEETIAAGPTGVVAEIKVANRDGVQSVIEIHQRAMVMGGRTLIVAVSHEVGLRKRAELATQRISRMFAALSATNEAIMRASSPNDLYQRVCDAAVHGGKFIITAVALPDATDSTLTIAAITGASMEQAGNIKLPLAGSASDGLGLVVSAYRSGAPAVSQDFLKDDRVAGWRPVAQRLGIASAAAVPLLRAGRPTGALMLYSGERHAFDEEIVNLLQRMAENVVFRMEHFEHEAERKTIAERVEYLATHDSLTGLANRVMFSQVLALAIETGRRYQRQLAVFFIDLDRFKVINDTLGHDAGDALLKEMSARFRTCVRASDLVARLGGDEFVVLAQEVGTEADVATIARNLLSAAIKPVEISGHECRVTASVGIAIYPDSGNDEQALMKNADIAMYMAKEEGKNNFQIHTREMKSPSLERMAMEAGLRHALDRGELSLKYQSKVDLRTGAINGVEALLRWNSPDLGAISPTQFIPIAEETGLIVTIGRWVLRAACAQSVAWTAAGLPPVRMAVNLSPRQFADPSLLPDIADALTQSGMSGSLLELEITESMVMHDIERAAMLLNAIKQLGVRIAIDDFGTGYSSLTQLKRFPIDTLKVDRSFIRDIPADPDDRAITEAIVALGRSLNLTVVAEGVETGAQQAFLSGLACDEMQGYLFSRPISADEFAELLRRHTATPIKLSA